MNQMTCQALRQEFANPDYRAYYPSNCVIRWFVSFPRFDYLLGYVLTDCFR